MLLLRKVNNEKAYRPGIELDEQSVAADFELDEDESGLSAFHLEAESEATEVAWLHAATKQDFPQKYSYVLIPEDDETLRALKPHHVDMKDLIEELRNRHFEFDEPDREALREIFDAVQKRGKTGRLTESQILSHIKKRVAEEPGFIGSLKPRWRAKYETAMATQAKATEL